MNAKPETLRIDILLHPLAALGVVCTALDVLNTLQGLARMRQPLAPARVLWRCTSTQAGGLRLPTAAWPELARPGFRGRPDLVLLPGWHVFSGPDLERHARDAFSRVDALRAVHAQGGQLLAVGTGVALLALADLLDGVPCAVPWTFMPTVARLAPRALLQTDAPFVHEGGIGSCDAPSALTALLLRVIKACGRCGMAELADTTAQALLHADERQSVAAQLVAEAPSHRLGAGSVERARRWLLAHLHEPYALQTLAREAATSPRSLLRHFEAAHGLTPYAYLKRMRVARAKVLLETSYQPVEQVAQACGFGDVGTFRRIFHLETGVLPAQWREQHRLRTRRRTWQGPAAAD
jgi:transcriptional regulator GlxA family with amidase domain